ncbi:2-deoxystreptamine glucosyltransferase [bacterium BMS3Bbin08]|nr:2-deoxystreptamine glucosyltransferase [bacterium BMS3Bbin08]HDH51543.1 glycosyltransferase family 1 protein [Nitrospirota bacterium]
MKKNILILDTGKEWGGGTNSLLELLRRVDREKYRFTVLFYHNFDKTPGSDVKSEIEKLGIDFLLLERGGQPAAAKILKETGRTILFFSGKLKKLYIFFMDYLFRIKKDAESIAALIRELNIDLIYMNNQPSSDLEGLIAAKKTGIRSLIHSRIETGLNPFEVSTTNKHLTKMICVSRGVKDSFVRQGVSGSICTVIYNGIDSTITPAVSADRVRQELGIKKDEILIGSVGSLIKRKRFSDLVASMAYLVNKKRHGRLKCLILGEGPEREYLSKEIEGNGLSDRVMLAGFKADAISYINAMDIFVLPSEREGFPRVILEAMLMGKPVVASGIAGPVELIIPEQTGLLFPAGDRGKLAESISTFISSPRFMTEAGELGRMRVIENFSIEKYVSEVSAIISEVAG